ncbi:MAG: leucyl aminopeptidase [Hyphomicrobiales bacterium]|nr:leucyl aminopeptidase [Hyphomicrobiales bacterium]
MKISFSKDSLPKSGAVALLVNGDGTLGKLAMQADKKADGATRRAMKSANFTGAGASILEVPGCKGFRDGLVFLAGLGDNKKLDPLSLERIGGRLMERAEKNNLAELCVVMDEAKSFAGGAGEAAAQIALGAQLRAYRFRKYKTAAGKNYRKKRNGRDVEPPRAPAQLTFYLGSEEKAKVARRAWQPLQHLGESVDMVRDLVNEPANILFPKAFAQIARKELTPLGVKVEILGESRMQALGMNALLQVGRGSSQESQLVVMQWNGLPKNKKRKPVAIVGKGVCFDSGGISLKPPPNMGDMKADMAGAACVVGLMRLLASRKAPVNVVGIIGLVENMVSGEAQRPGDIVTSMSGQTIEVLNTDAEGRLVLSDAIYYARERFTPDTIIDLATLTGAILICLGRDRAGLFSNDDALAGALYQAGENEGELLWRLPMGDCYDKMMDSPVADVKNIGGGRYAGSITAAQFLGRFVGDTSWAHLDIAGTAMDSPITATNASWASGFGVRLLNRYLADRFEK